MEQAKQLEDILMNKIQFHFHNNWKKHDQIPMENRQYHCTNEIVLSFEME